MFQTNQRRRIWLFALLWTGIGLFFGTSEPELIPANAQSFADPARIAAKYKFVPAASAKGKYGPVDMEWDLRLQK